MWPAGSLVVACRLSCPVGTWNLSFLTRIEPVSPALEGRCLTTGPPGKSLVQFFLKTFFFHAAAAAKSLQSCPTLCDPRDGSPPGSPVPGSLQAGTLEWEGVANPTGVVIVVLLYGFWIMLGVKQNVFVDLYKC